MTLTVLAVSSEPLLRAIAANPDAGAKTLAELSGKKPNNIARDLDVLAGAGLIVRHPPHLTAAGADALAAIDRARAGPAPTPIDGVAEIAIDLIDPDPTLNPRKQFDADELAGLAASIAEKGVLQPILLRQGLVAGRYRIVAGERRWRAARDAGKTTILAIAREMDDVEALEVALIENVQRTDLTPMEEARGYDAIVAARRARDPSVSLRQAKEVIADATKRTVRHVEQRLALLKLSTADQGALERGEISIEIARGRAASVEANRAPPLNADQLLLLAEIADFVVKGKGLRAGVDRQVGPAIRDDATIAKLVGLNLVVRWTDYDSRIEVIQFKGRGLLALDELMPALASRRAPSLEKLRANAGREAKLDAYATPWLNPPFEPHPDEKTRLAQRAEHRRLSEETERLALAEREERARQHAAEMGPQGRAFLAEVREFEAAAPGLSRANFTTNFGNLLKKHGATAPWSLGWEAGESDPHVHDAEGRPNAGRGPVLEARRRMIAIAINYAAGEKLWSGDELATPWSSDLRLGREPGDVVRIAGGATYAIVEVLGARDRTYLAQQLRSGKPHGQPTTLLPAAIEELISSSEDVDAAEENDEEGADDDEGVPYGSSPIFDPTARPAAAPPPAAPAETSPAVREALSYDRAEDVLRAVAKWPGNGLTGLQSAIRGAPQMNPSAIGRRLDGLHRAGLIDKPRGSTLTAAGRAVLAALDAEAKESRAPATSCNDGVRTGPLAAMLGDDFAQQMRAAREPG